MKTLGKVWYAYGRQWERQRQRILEVRAALWVQMQMLVFPAHPVEAELRSQRPLGAMVS